MKKLKYFIILLLIVSCVFSSCAPKYGFSQYTEDAPYVLENAEIDDDMSRIAIAGTKLHWNVKGNIVKSIIAENYSSSVFRVKKANSKSYYWEYNDKAFFFTKTEVEIIEIINNNGNDYFNNLSVGDKIPILEYYSFDPDGNFLAGLNEDISNTPPYNTSPYKRLPETHQYIRFTMNNVVDLTGMYGISELNCLRSPIIKNNTEYIIVLDEDLIISNTSQNIRLEYGTSDYSIPYELCSNAVYYKELYELSSDAADYAKTHFSDYESLEEISEMKFAKSEDLYYRNVWACWEAYGDRVGT